MKKIDGCNKNGVPSGATCFFRNRPLFDTVKSAINNLNLEKCDILFHSCSAGAEVYSFVIACLLDKNTKFDFHVWATDIEDQYMKIARNALYSAEEIKNLSEAERSYFVDKGNGLYEVAGIIREKVSFLPCTDFRSFESNKLYHVVFILNSLCYVSESDQSVALNRIASYNRNILVISGGHLRTIKNDLKITGYMPYTDNLELIHRSWLHRPYVNFNSFSLRMRRWLRAFLPYRLPTSPGVPIADHSLPTNLVCKEVDNYKYCSIFYK